MLTYTYMWPQTHTCMNTHTHIYTDNGDFSGLSEHSSDELHLTINNDTLKQPIHVEESEAESATKAEENSVTPFESESEQVYCTTGIQISGY